MTPKTIFALAAVVSLAATPALAGPPAARPPHAGPKTPKTTTAAPKIHGAPVVKSVGASAVAGGAKAPKVHASPKVSPKTSPSVMKVSGPKATGPKTTGPKSHATAKATGPKGSKTHGPKSTPPGQARKTTTSPTAGPGTTPVSNVTTPAALPKNPKLVAKLQGMLPAGMTVEQAAAGFRNQGQFIAAVNVSNNLGIPFADLKTKMVTDGLSLGQSIQSLKPTVDGTVEADRATRWAGTQLEAEPR